LLRCSDKNLADSSENLLNLGAAAFFLNFQSVV
jgi:hypothetical protein